ncbi:alkaline phosphatase [Allobranchiibius sp. GilTou38]|uniref:alkaline phosphatase n=1 Tax=Allobranchiibius sp. GilTou38 TaxID=2815210 RepID=UPI001FB5ADC6|nr:alkaline phosphatase [Allobranchiibius sp. GilTou38]
MITTRSRSARRSTWGIGLAAVAALSTVGIAAAATQVDLTQHGGARRLSGDDSRTVARAVDGHKARNVILLIGDGMGDSEITSARNYRYGAAGRLPGIDALPLTGQYTTYSLTKDGKPDYVTDSAASGSGWSTGTKTYNGAISVDVHGAPQKTLLELAKARGLKTGDVSTAEIQDATPAVQVSHVTARSCYGPVATTKICPSNAKENGGRGSITEQLLDTRPDVTLGGGATTFGEKATTGRYTGQTLLSQAQRRGFRVVTDDDSLSGVRTADQRTPVLGLFAPGNMPVRWVGPKATPTGGAQPAARCTENPARTTSTPKLASMTTKAISLLSKGNKQGFFLQVEGASIDKQDHAADACGQIGEAIDLDEAVQAALAYAKKDGNTSVFVTADHAHTSQIVEAGSTTPGLTVNLLTADNAPMTLNYATAAAGASQQHTGTQLRIAGYGPQAANVVGLTDQTDLFFTISRALELDRPGRH